VTGRRKLVKFQGCYHGWHDAVARNVISTADKVGALDPLSAGSSPAELADTIVCRFNDLDDVARALDGGDVAAIIVEPIQHNIGAVMPVPGFLQGLRDLTTSHGALLIFDEVITGIRHGLGGYQAVAGVRPDLTCLGKALANGYPAAALGGSAALLDEFGTAGGPVFFAGTFNGHPAAMAATIATLEVLAEGDVLDQMFARGERVRRELQQLARGHGLTATAAGFGSVFVLYFLGRAPTSFDDLLENDASAYVAFHRGLIDRGHFLFPMNLKRSNVSAAHSDSDIDRLLADADHVLKGIAAA
jgi:glutamate-1-semialdehyde 2,1-aminomutase